MSDLAATASGGTRAARFGLVPSRAERTASATVVLSCSNSDVVSAMTGAHERLTTVSV